MDPATVHPDAIVVLGCRVPSAAHGALHARAEVAAAAYRELSPSLVVASGGRLWNGVAEASALRDYMVSLGVPEHVIVRELFSLSTVENAVYTAEILRGASLSHPLLVTSDWHVERALACFAACGVAAVARAATTHDGPVARVKRRFTERVRARIDVLSLPLWFPP